MCTVSDSERLRMLSRARVEKVATSLHAYQPQASQTSDVKLSNDQAEAPKLAESAAFVQASELGAGEADSSRGF